MTSETILKKGANCWRIEPSGRAAFIVDAADYFEAFVSAVRQARRSVYIAGWDIDSRIRLLRREEKEGAFLPLGEFLNETVGRHPELRIHILCWDYSMIYAGERELLPVFRLGWKTHPRIHFRADSEHPIGASQHQKFVVIDDALAFCGGIDLTKMRWDTSDHLPEDSRRRDPDGDAYPPFHDIQMAVDDGPARALGDLFRERWQRAAGVRIPPVEDSGSRPWPRNVVPDLTDVRVAVARTFPGFKDRPKVQEAAVLYRDAVSAAEQYIYMENQYLTSGWIADALSESLERPGGPEIVLVLPRKSGGWLEQSTMDAIRFRVLNRLFESDRHHRLRVLHPVSESGDPIFVHAKAMIVDDRFIRVGSTNLSNRSMAFDSECDLALEVASDSPGEVGIQRFRNRLLAEHLGTTPDAVADALDTSGSLIGVIESFSKNSRTLKPIPMDMDGLPIDTIALIKDPKRIDPEEPIEIDRMLDYFVEEEKKPAAWLKPFLILVILAALAGAWRWTPLSEWIEIENLKAWAISAKERPLTILFVVGAFVAGGLVMVPVTLMVGVTAVVFSPVTGGIYALAGCLASAAAAYGVGAGMGKPILRKISGSRLKRLRKWLDRPGVLPIAVARNIPVVPFTILNLIAGATRINLKDFILGTALGMLPGIAAISAFTDRMAAAVQEPSWANIGAAALVAIVFGIGIWWSKKRLFR